MEVLELSYNSTTTLINKLAKIKSEKDMENTNIIKQCASLVQRELGGGGENKAWLICR
ncbi:hypothetical protein MS2017_1704 [Bathymodiolus thermophilus thioautotrophic gill symbiont]|uniref:Uncharacterized protein n=1 Tax=Bathymodiolus thermophilus thioautotrophic gill symbiont TaxID=2360 RepID=A0A3G3INQ8_9GAMM|nr:hypothetical protein [Bathymodiolus thermophilus thioautotrophic gill symbiont]AYQ57378.1 hypothetical protein MS2017_1704 [Bathymodiolus thermophilus thioautotrophic gill symbiont]